MQHRLSKYALSAILVAAVGCTIKTTTTSPNGTDNGGGSNAGGAAPTTPVPSTQATAMVTGHVDATVNGNVRFAVNGQARATVLAPDQSFVVRDVPAGDVTFECDDDDVKGTLTITNVQAGEMIDVTIKRQGDAIVIVIVTRTTVSQPPVQVNATGGDALEIDDDDVCYYLKPGTYKRDIVIKGHDVHLFGASHTTCTVDDVSVIAGTLTISGDRAQVFDVQIAGKLVITGHDDRVQDTCNSCFDQGCDHDCNAGCACDDSCPKPEDAGPPPPPPPPDAGCACTEDAAPPPPVDAGPPPPPPDAAPPPPPDAGANDAGMNDGM